MLISSPFVEEFFIQSAVHKIEKYFKKFLLVRSSNDPTCTASESTVFFILYYIMIGGVLVIFSFSNNF